LATTYNNGLDLLEERGRLAATSYYTALQKAEKQNKEVLEAELKELTRAMSEAVNSGEIEEGSEAFNQMQININKVKEALDEADISLAKYAKTMRELEWSYFSFTQDRIGQMTQESDFLMSLLTGDNVDKQGNFTDTGLTNLGLHGMNYNIYMNQADQYAKEIKKINEDIAKDPYNTDLITQREKLLKLQQDSIKAANDEKDAMVALVEEGIKAQLDALKELIDSYEDSLDAAKSLNDYRKNIEKQTANIASIQKQITAYGGDSSEENISRLQKLNQELIDAQEELEETQYDQYIKDQKKLLDDLYLEYETTLNTRLDDVDLLISELTDDVNFNADTINKTINDAAKSVGYTISGELSTLWKQAATTAEDIKAAINGGDSGSLANMLINTLQSEGKLSAADAEKLKNAINGGDNSLATKLINQLITEGQLSSADAELLKKAMNGEDDNSVAKRILATTGAITTYSNNFTSTMTTTNAAINGIKAYTDGLIKKSEEEATAKIAATATTTEVDKSVVPATQNGESTKKEEQKETTSTFTAPTLTDSIKKHVAAAIWNGNYGWSTNPTRANRLTEVFGSGNGIQTIVNKGYSYTSSYSPKGYSYKEMRKKFKNYKRGGEVDFTGLAWLDGTPGRPETVLDAEDTKNFVNLRDSLRAIAKQPLSLLNGGNYSYSYSDKAADIASSVLSRLGSGADTGTNIGDINLNIEIDHVQDYNDLVRQMQSDKKFEKLIEAMSINKLVGRSSMDKYRIRF